MTTFSYWPTGLLKQVTLPDTSYLLYTYDNAHRLTQISDGLGNKIVYTLDAMGNRTAENSYDPSNLLHYTHSRVFNSLNELYQDVNAAGTANVTTTFGYDNNGNQLSIAAPLSRNTSKQYDALNRLSLVTDPANGNTYFGYDANDNLTSLKDPRNFTTGYSYTGFGDLTKVVSPDTGTTNTTYDSGGNLATSTDARGALASYSYDALNRVTSVAYSNGGVTDQTILFTYDAGTYGKGRLTGALDANHSMSWVYDGLGRVTSKSQTVNGVTKSVGYAYTNGDLTTLTTPFGKSIAYAYNANHQITSITVNGTTVISGVTYEPFGAVNGWTWGNGTVTTRAYDADEKVSQISSAGVKGYSYDDAFRITGITDTSTGSSNWTYGYDALDRLTSGINGTLTRGWTYDADSNRATETGTSPSTYHISASNNRLTSISGTLNRSYTYDLAGNTLTYGTFTHTYNNRGRLVNLSNSGNGVFANYVYNALGQLIETTGTNGTALDWYDEAGHLLGQYNSSGGLYQETVWLGDIPVATLRPNGSSVLIYYVHTDHLNTPHQVTRAGDNVQMWTWFTEPFGNTNVNTNPQGAGVFDYQLRFPGQFNGSGVNALLPNGFRDYDPLVGRYIESDPLGLTGGVNTYAYALDNPITFADPSGLQAAAGVVVIDGVIVTGVSAAICASLPGCRNAAADAINALSKAIDKEKEREECEKGCDAQWDKDMFQCELMWKMRGRPKGGYSECKRAANARYVKCYQDCGNKCK
jgi:RHS repeat-associated protein